MTSELVKFNKDLKKKQEILKFGRDALDKTPHKAEHNLFRLFKHWGGLRYLRNNISSGIPIREIAQIQVDLDTIEKNKKNFGRTGGGGRIKTTINLSKECADSIKKDCLETGLPNSRLLERCYWIVKDLGIL